MIGLNAQVAATYRATHERWVRTPWIGPKGERTELRLRPHGDPSYQEKLASNGVEPLAPDERARRLGKSYIDLLRNANGNVTDEDDPGILDMLEIGFRSADYPVAYSFPEVEKMRKEVRDLLVVGVRTIGADGVIVEETEEDVSAWFASDEALRFISLVPGSVALKEKLLTEGQIAKRQSGDDAKPTEVATYLGGRPEGTAVAAFALKEAALDHEFQELRVPLESSSDSTRGDQDITEQRPASPPP